MYTKMQCDNTCQGSSCQRPVLAQHRRDYKKWLDKYFYWAIFHLPQQVSNTVSFTPPFGLAHNPKSISFSWKKCLKRGSSVLLVLFLVHLMFIINENVLWFKVPVSVTGLVNVGHCCSNLQPTLRYLHLGLIEIDENCCEIPVWRIFCSLPHRACPYLQCSQTTLPLDNTPAPCRFWCLFQEPERQCKYEESHFRYCFSPGEACRCSGDRALSLQLFQVWCKRNLDICQQANATNLILGKSSPSCLLSIILMATLTPVRRWVASFTWRVRDALQCSVMW